MKSDVRLVATKIFSDLYLTVGSDSVVGNIIDQAYDSYLNSQNLPSIKDHEEYKNIYNELKIKGVKK